MTRITAGSITVALLASLFLAGAALADDVAELKQHVKWSIFHEGCRVYAPNNRIGNIGQIRQCIYQVEGENRRAQQLLAAANDDLLLNLVQQAANEIPAEFQLRENFQWVMYHEGQAETIRVMRDQGNFEGIRSVYYAKQQHNPNARNLLAAVSNAQLSALINSL